MADNIEYKYHIVDQGTNDTLLTIASKEDIGVDVRILEKLNPNIKDKNKVLDSGTRVLVSVGSMTDSVDSFKVGTLYVYDEVTQTLVNGSLVSKRVIKAKIINAKGVAQTVDIDANENSGGNPDISLESIVDKTKDKSWYFKELKVADLMKLNPWCSQQMALIPVNTTVLLEVCVPGTATMVGVEQAGIMTDTTRTCFVRLEKWDHDVNNTSGFEVHWSWRSSDGKWWSEGITKVTDTETFEFTHTPSEQAIEAKVRIRPMSATGKLTLTEFEWCPELSFSFSSKFDLITPSSPPRVEIKNYKSSSKLTATYDSLPVQSGSITHVQFYVVRDNETSAYNTKDRHVKHDINKVTGYVQYTCNIEAGHKYRVRARCCKEVNKDVNGTFYSSWSEFSTATNTLPTPPSLGYIHVLGNNIVQFQFMKVNCADKYEIQYVPKDTEKYKEFYSATEYFNSMTSSVTTVKLDANDIPEKEPWLLYKVVDIPNGEYLARVRASNETASEWSNIEGFILGQKPDSPTTWSSTTTISVGEPLTLYWTHNSKDGAKETIAQVRLTDQSGNNTTYTIERTTENTLNKIGAAHGFPGSSSTILNRNPSISGPDAIIEPGTFVWTYLEEGTHFFLVTDNEDEATSYLLVDTSSYYEGSKVKWAVRTAGVLKDSSGNPEYGPWSIEREFDIYAAPILRVNLQKNNGDDLEEGMLNTLPLTIKLSTGNAINQHPTGYYVSVIAVAGYDTVDEVGNDITVTEGSKVFSKYYDTTDTSYDVQLSANHLSLKNNEIYKVSCSVSMSSGLTAETETATFTVYWLTEGYVPNAEIGIDSETLTARIRPFAQGAGDSVNLFVYRREFDGSFTELVTDSTDPESGIEHPFGTWITDPHPSLDYARYRIVSRDKFSGAINYFDTSRAVQEHSVVIQWDEKWDETLPTFTDVDGDTVMTNSGVTYSGSILKLPYNIDVANTHSPDVSLARYIGRKRPVSYYGTQLGETATWNVEIPKSDKETLYMLRRLAIYMGNVYVREPSGSGYWASINISFSQKHLALTIPVTINITPVEGGI